MHLADLHFGKMINGFSMIDDQLYVLEQVKSYIKEYQPDAVLLAGDIYDRSLPPAKAVTLYSDFLREVLIELKTPILAVAGNHDGADFLSFGHELLEAAGYYVAGKYTKKMKKVTLNEVNFYLLPFAEAAVVREAFEDQTIKSLADAMGATLAANEIDPSARNVLITHAYVTGGSESDSEKPLHIGGKQSVPISLFEGFDYVALGHLHRPQKIKHPNVRYSGSLLKYSFSEEHDHKSMTMIDLGAKGNIAVTHLPLKPKYDMRSLKGTLADLLGLEKSADYLNVTLTDEQELLEPMAKLRQIYPNIMTLQLQRNLTEFFKQSNLQKTERTAKTTGQLFADFYEHHRQKPLPDSGKKIIDDVLNNLDQEAGQ